ncbi:hypothetical protein L1987_33013 [Smallanthus sonchifolius]|uniref:Uncharacterized protein n=1 Tax=Smallanthus sonchifolius TaxID=185202 RepID=A0ACB9HRJ3_9ASTR|nr:hypothetical protein L1987_33013 [Smallanthus sonchifolius]
MFDLKPILIPSITFTIASAAETRSLTPRTVQTKELSEPADHHLLNCRNTVRRSPSLIISRKLDATHAFAREGDTENLIKCVEAGIPVDIKISWHVVQQEVVVVRVVVVVEVVLMPLDDHRQVHPIIPRYLLP